MQLKFSLDKACQEAPKFMKLTVTPLERLLYATRQGYTIIYVYRWMFYPNMSQNWCSIWSKKYNTWWAIVLRYTVIFLAELHDHHMQKVKITISIPGSPERVDEECLSMIGNSYFLYPQLYKNQIIVSATQHNSYPNCFCTNQPTFTLHMQS